MINYETIISNFDDKTTLYNWLRKVEEALKHASATNFVVNKKGNATLSFSITFADGTTLESGDIVLQQGESVDQARIASGILQLHLTNGTWLTAGNVKPVSNFSIDASQHLIVNYQDGTSQDLGAIFNGNVNIAGTLNATKVTGDEIIENMTGYTFNKPNNENLTKDVLYAGVVKNGNKLTFCIFAKLNRTGVVEDGICNYGSFGIPSSIGAKLYPYRSQWLEAKKVYLSNNYNDGVEAYGLVYKDGNDVVRFNIYGINSIELNTDYVVRFEVTFLLSDNLAL